MAPSYFFRAVASVTSTGAFLIIFNPVIRDRVLADGQIYIRIIHPAFSKPKPPLHARYVSTPTVA